ncbi:MAG: YbaY family lipoprotein, partial [Dongiaceae bacterium]
LPLLALLLLVALAACREPAPPAPAAGVTGTVTYRERIALPPSAIVDIRLEDVSLQDAPSVVIGAQQIEGDGLQVPIPFEVGYDPAAIDPRHTYAVSARIMDGDRLLFINDTSYAVITQGNPVHVDILIKPAP